MRKRNINRLLENSRRSDVRGYNIYSMGRNATKELERFTEVSEKWDAPSLGLPGHVAIGHQIDKTDIVVPGIFVNGKKSEFSVIRNHWTPAYMTTYYRSKPDTAYRTSGVIVVKETKCFTEDDVFLGHMMICNDDNVPKDIEIRLELPFDRVDGGLYSVEAEILPQSLKKRPVLKGYAAAKTDRGTVCKLNLPAHGSQTIRYGFSFDPENGQRAAERLDRALAVDYPFEEAERRFNQWMWDHVPELDTENTDILKVYFYRFWVIKNAIHTPATVLPDSDFKGECVYESAFGDWFGAPIGLPISMQIEEMKWMRTTESLRSQIGNWCEGVGNTKAYIQFTPMAIWDYYLHCGDRRLIEDSYSSCREYTLKKCKTPNVKLPETVGSWKTGAEYQPSFYQYTEPQWDWRCDREGLEEGFQCTTLIRVDECMMLVANLKACEKMAGLLGNEADRAFFRQYGQETVDQIVEQCWNEEKQFFFDVDVATGKQCDQAYSYDGFMPVMWDLMDKNYYGVFDKIVDEHGFSCHFSTTTVDKGCPMYWFDNCIVGPSAATRAEPHRYDCCWNGPVWPFATTLVLEALGTAARCCERFKELWNCLFSQYTELHFDYGDRSTPCICEHYRPSDGMSFSPYTEYFHSEWISLFLSYWAGIHVTEGGIEFTPLTEEEFCIENVVIGGQRYRFAQEKVDGVLNRTVTELL